MKKYLIAIGVALAVTVSNAQTTTITVRPNSGTIGKVQLALNALGSATNWAFVPYATYGARAVQVLKQKERAKGGGIIGIYNFNSFIGVGGGVDYITGIGKSQLTVLSANIQAQLPLNPLSTFFTNSWAQSFTVTPFVYSALGKPFSGTTQPVVTHEGEGVNVDLFKWNSWDIGIGYAYIERQNAGNYNGDYDNFFLTAHRPF